MASLEARKSARRGDPDEGPEPPTYATGIHHETFPKLKSDEQLIRDYRLDDQPGDATPTSFKDWEFQENASHVWQDVTNESSQGATSEPQPATSTVRLGGEGEKPAGEAPRRLHASAGKWLAAGSLAGVGVVLAILGHLR